MEFNDPVAMKSSLLVNLFKQSVKTFSPRCSLDFSSDFPQNLKKLKELLDQVRAHHVKLDPAFNEASLWENKDKAPCTYIEIFQNHNFNMSIFILKPGATMPLHDHPYMYGLLKVISGSVRVKCFSKLSPENVKNYPFLQNEKMSTNVNKYKTFLAEVSDYKICNAESESCFLTPDDSNFHEIEAIEGPSAFLDILAPPYSTSIKGVGERQCKYYEVLQELSQNIVQLREIPLPGWFYCDQAPYLGPVLL